MEGKTGMELVQCTECEPTPGFLAAMRCLVFGTIALSVSVSPSKAFVMDAPELVS